MAWMKRIGTKRKKKRNGYPPLQTERLVLRMFELSDTVDVFDYAKSPVVGPMAGWTPHQSIEESRRVVHQFINHGDVWAIVEKKSGRVIGSIGLHRDAKRDVEKVLMLGYVLGEKYWGKGYATEAARAVMRFAFDKLGCPMVTAFHYPKNIKSKRVIKKLGFQPEGRLRLAAALPNGTLCDEECYSVTREEYGAAEKKANEKAAASDAGKAKG